MWEIAVILICFSVSLVLVLTFFQRLLSRATADQATVLMQLLHPILNPPPVEQAPEVEQAASALPSWLAGVDSTDLMEGRVLDWDIPIIPDEESIGPQM